MTTTQNVSLAPAAKRRWYQFSLKTLFIVFTLLACAAAWIARPISQVRKEERIAQEIEKLGGSVTWGGLSQGRGRKGWSYVGAVDLRGTDATDDDLADLKSLRSMTHIFLNDTQVTSDGLKHLKGLPLLKQLELSGTAVTDDGLKQLGEFSNLEVLLLAGCPISDEGLQHLTGLQQLWMLYLDDTKITDEGVARLTKLSKLRTLGLNRTQVTKEGLLLQTPNFKLLEIIHLTGTGMTAEEEAEVNRALAD